MHAVDMHYIRYRKISIFYEITKHIAIINIMRKHTIISYNDTTIVDERVGVNAE